MKGKKLEGRGVSSCARWLRDETFDERSARMS